LLGDALDGLKPSFLATPFAAAQVMSESALLREEGRWIGLLDQSAPNADFSERCRIEGLLRSADDTCFTLTTPALQVLIDSPNGLDGFYISGQQSNPPAGVQTQVTITVNGIQEKTFMLSDVRHFNLGISNPVVLPGVTNCVVVAFSTHCPGAVAGSMRPIDPCCFITLAHLVIDGHLITRLAGA
jgi:hypothetical protein